MWRMAMLSQIIRRGLNEKMTFKQRLAASEEKHMRPAGREECSRQYSSAKAGGRNVFGGQGKRGIKTDGVRVTRSTRPYRALIRIRLCL